MTENHDPQEDEDGFEVDSDPIEAIDELLHDAHGAPRPIWDEGSSSLNWSDPTADAALDHLEGRH